MHRMMQTSGTSEGLRGLIDSSLLKSVKKIIGCRSLFGPSILPFGISHIFCRILSQLTGRSDQHNGNLCPQ